jgi:hypothetical protein
MENQTVAISYASEDRQEASELANALKKLGVEVFLDTDHSASLWGRNLYDDLTSIYRESRHCIMLISKNYVSKMWTSLERKAAQERDLREPGYILPVRLDNTEMTGLLSTVACLSWPPQTCETIANLVNEKLSERASLRNNINSGIGMLPVKDKVGPPVSTIKLHQQLLENLYGPVNRDKTPEYIFGYLARTIGYLSKDISKQSTTEKSFVRPL